MGAEQSKSRTEESDVADVPIQFSQDVVKQLAEAASAPAPSFQRQSSLDERIQERIHAEVARLREEEEDVRRAIAEVLEKENLDRETKAAAGNGESSEEEEEDGPLNSVVLLGDLEEVRQRVDKFHAKESMVGQEASAAAQAALNCYKNNVARPLDCWREVRAFQHAVGELEQDYLSSLQ